MLAREAVPEYIVPMICEEHVSPVNEDELSDEQIHEVWLWSLTSGVMETRGFSHWRGTNSTKDDPHRGFIPVGQVKTISYPSLQRRIGRGSENPKKERGNRISVGLSLGRSCKGSIAQRFSNASGEAG